MHGNFYQYSLLFSNLYDQLFRSYHLEIDNGMGLRQHTVTLIQGEEVHDEIANFKYVESF